MSLASIHKMHELGFAAKSLYGGGAGGRPGENRFHRHSAIEADLARPIYHAHSAVADFFKQLVVTDALADEHVRSRGSEMRSGE